MIEPATHAATIAADKEMLRRRLRATRAGLAHELVVARSLAAAERLLALPELAVPCTVALYAAITREGELDPRLADPLLRARGHRLVYPRIVSRKPPTLAFHLVEDLAQLEVGGFAVPEPSADAPTASATDIDVFVVPGVGFTATGARLGYGGGYYDAALSAAPRALRVGYAHPEQRLDQLPTTSRDERIDRLVFPDTTLSCAPRPGRRTPPGDQT